MTTTIITGATSGIGYELARQLDAKGHHLILVGRRQRETLDTDFFTAERYCQADLAQPDASERLLNFLEQQNITAIDLVIHNAGIGYFGEIANQSVDSIIDVMTVNLTAPIQLTHALLPHLKRAQGKIALISSVTATLPIPDYAIYIASKAALDEFGDNLRIELQADDIDVQVIHPGATQTEMHSKLGIPDDRMDTSKFPSAESVASQIIQVINSNKKQASIGLSNKILRFAGKHVAGLVDFGMKRSNR